MTTPKNKTNGRTMEGSLMRSITEETPIGVPRDREAKICFAVSSIPLVGTTSCKYTSRQHSERSAFAIHDQHVQNKHSRFCNITNTTNKFILRSA